jgi:hypothetical protein
VGKAASAGVSMAYSDIARAALTKVIGEGGASTILFYTKEPHEEDFEKRLRGILGKGADVVIQELDERLKASEATNGH